MTPTDLRAPPGDPVPVFTAAAKLITLATGTEDVRTALGRHAGAAVAALSNPRAAEAAEPPPPS